MFSNEWVLPIIFFTVSIFSILIRPLLIANKPVPQAVIDFPIYESAEGDYISIREKVKQFIDNILEGKSGQLSLTANDLNCLSTRGVTPRKGQSLFPDYYEIKDNVLYSRKLCYPSASSIDGYEVSNWVHSFFWVEEFLFEKNVLIHYSEKFLNNGHTPSGEDSDTSTKPFKRSRLFKWFTNFDGKSDPKRTNQLTQSIKSIEIKDDKLVLNAGI
jgi:hypothetical protein